MFLALIDVVAPVLICAALGYAWAKRGGPFETEFVTGLVVNIGTPCLVISTLTRLQLSPDAFAQMALAAVLALAIFMAIGAVILKLAGLPFHSYLPPIVFANTGNMGLPLALFAFGEAGLALAIVVFAINAVAQFTIGSLISAGQISLGQLVRTPMIWAIVVALVLMGTGTKLPTFAAKTLELLGGFAIPLMLLALGVSLARLQVRSYGRTLAFSLLRLGMGAAVGFALAEALGMEGIARGVLILDCAMPVAVFNYLFAQRNKRAAEEVASMVVASTVISFATLPLLLMALL